MRTVARLRRVNSEPKITRRGASRITGEKIGASGREGRAPQTRSPNPRPRRDPLIRPVLRTRGGGYAASRLPDFLLRDQQISLVMSGSFTPGPVAAECGHTALCWRIHPSIRFRKPPFLRRVAVVWSQCRKQRLAGDEAAPGWGASPSQGHHTHPGGSCPEAGVRLGSLGSRGGGLERKDGIGARILLSPRSFIREGGREEGLPAGATICTACWKQREREPAAVAAPQNHPEGLSEARGVGEEKRGLEVGGTEEKREARGRCEEVWGLDTGSLRVAVTEALLMTR
ncbi:hypothetical protein GN956_G9569 [Arapaima gigas]